MAPTSGPPWLYVCEVCGRLGPMADFQGECKPGWTHGRLLTVYPENCSARVAEAVRELLKPACARGTLGCDVTHDPDDEGPCFGTEETP